MLSDLIQYAQEVVGIKPTDSEKRAQLVRWINRAAKEIWDSWDMPGSIQEQTFELGEAATDESIWYITLPWYVNSIRGVRHPNAYDKVKTVDARPKFASGTPWKQPMLQWRILGKTPLIREMPADDKFIITRGTDEVEPFSVSITGATGQSAITTESVTFIFGGSPEIIVGGATAEEFYRTINQWVHDSPIGIKNISKSGVTLNDVKIYDQSNNLLATIPNRMTKASNTLVQIHDDSKSIFESVVEILFKSPYIPLYYDSDDIFLPELEDAVIWKLREHWYSTKTTQDKSLSEEAVLANRKCQDLVQRICGNLESDTERRVTFKEDPRADAPLKSCFHRYG